MVVVHSSAPIRICDNGSWTDTWFAGHGRVFNVAVSPLVEVRVAAYAATEARPRVVLHPVNLGAPYEGTRTQAPWGPHPLLEAAVALMQVPDHLSIEATLQIESTQAQARLHPDLVGAEARQVIEVARRHGALGWKVNGAGGAGGSLTLLCDDSPAAQRSLLGEIGRTSAAFRNIPIRLSLQGLRVWREGPD